MRALKFLVIGMGLVIVVATTALVMVVVQRAGQLGVRGSPAADHPIAVPPGFRITATQLSGDRLLVRLEGREPGASGDEIRLLTVELDRGNAQRTIRFMLPAAAEAQ